jgi:hypothetical protein
MELIVRAWEQSKQCALFDSYSIKKNEDKMQEKIGSLRYKHSDGMENIFCRDHESLYKHIPIPTLFLIPNTSSLTIPHSPLPTT